MTDDLSAINPELAPQFIMDRLRARSSPRKGHRAAGSLPRAGASVHTVPVFSAVRVPAHVNVTSKLPRIAIGAFWLISAGICAVHTGLAGSALYLLLAVLVGAILCIRFPAHYVSFVWQVFFFTPCVRRLIDYHSGWNPTNMVVLAPFVVAALGGVTILRRNGRASSVRFAFLLLLLSCVYALLVGIITNGAFSAAFEMLDWAVPIVFAWYLCCVSIDRRCLFESIERTFLLGALVMSVYGIVQFVSPAGWDCAWLIDSGMNTSMGRPEPYGIRLFSTMNSAGPFSVTMIAALLISLLSRRRIGRLVATGAGVSVLLTLVRAAWFGLAIGIAGALLAMPTRQRVRLLFILGITAVLLGIGLFAADFGDTIGQRLNTFSNLSDDYSLNTRLETYLESGASCLLQPIGTGLGSTGNSVRLHSADLGVAFDSGLLNIPYVLGWPGTLLYCAGAGMLLQRAARSRGGSIKAVSVAIAVAALSQILFVNVMTGVQGLIVWTFVVLPFAGMESPAK